MTATPTIQTAGITKSYGENTVLRGVDLAVAPGTVFALLGSNGAGKTTLVKILSTLLKADTASTSSPRPLGCGSRSASPDSSPPSTRS
jgi:ABC-2 type transport system ATP-binding protein